MRACRSLGEGVSPGWKWVWVREMCGKKGWIKSFMRGIPKVDLGNRFGVRWEAKRHTALAAEPPWCAG